MKTVLKSIWNVLKSNPVMKITAVLFAVILWSYVLAEIDPPRTRVISDIRVQYQNVAELNEMGLEISKSLSEALDKVNVKVEAKQSGINTLSEEDIEAYVDLSTIKSVGEHTLNIEARITGVNGARVLEKSNSTVTLHVDKYMVKPVPVAVNTIGSVPNGYYASEPSIAPTTVEIKGAQTDVEKVASAICNVDLTGLTEGYSKNMEIDLLDGDGNIIDKSVLDDLPSVIVTLDVKPMKTVPIDVSGSIIGQDEVASGYEVADITCEPETVQIAGDASVLAGISKVALVPYTVSGKSISESVALDYELPQGVTVLTSEKAQVYITIREISKTKTYSGINLASKNLSNGLRVQYTPSKVDVTVIAGVSEVSKLSRSDIVPYVDLEGLEAGTYSRDVLFEIPKGFSEQNFTSSEGTVTVKIY